MKKRGETVFLTVGWENFVKDNELEDGKMMEFIYDCDRTFYVVIFGHGGVSELRVFPQAVVDVGDYATGEEEEEEEKNKTVDEDWMSCLRNEKLENILLIPSGTVQDHWPASLKDFVHTLRSLSFPREQADLQTILGDVNVTPLSTVLSQGMNLKKKHEVEVLSSVVSSVVNSVGESTVVDVGSGQGYLAQVLSFQYKHSVVAIDSSSHHGNVSDARAARIGKHFASQMRKSGLNLFSVSSGNKCPDAPTTITCRVLSTEMLKSLTNVPPEDNGLDLDAGALNEGPKRSCSLVLAGLHACGDLSVTMLRTFMECEEVKAVVSIGCCYNLLSEKASEDSCYKCGFPMSAGLKSLGFSLGKNARDLACQSAERWSSLGEDAGLQNFELHSFHTDVNKSMRHPSSNPNSYSSFEKFCLSAFSRLNLEHPQDLDLTATWNEADAFTELIGPYWSIRAALGPVLETLILLDRLMFLQEQGDSLEVSMLPIFDPTISPRNVAVIAKRL
ncbi:hypothetical protein IGI04_022377 [Brassica rapa subsp. trilocularis]|uniref:TF-B3 domain-containing protein n=1 Tax=Brassica rapa subsp. trilocularis TaxID=1813537 RepID=A0ABQ7M467_BRACM|nr:hypothetical protein IGI04_022377 [Brassica rapa subsp. trilocularis]